MLSILVTVWRGAGALCHAMELSLASARARPGAVVKVAVMIDAVEHLAGVKLTLGWDAETLTYVSGNVTPAASSFLHVVNDRKPGRLILVMAGGRGIGGRRLKLFNLRFRVSTAVTRSQTVKINIVESQLMSDALKDLKHTERGAKIIVSARSENK